MFHVTYERFKIWKLTYLLLHGCILLFFAFRSAKRIQAKEATRRVAEDAQVIRRLRAVATYISSMDTAYVRENPENQLTPRKIAEHKVQDSSTLGTWTCCWYKEFVWNPYETLEFGVVMRDE